MRRNNYVYQSLDKAPSAPANQQLCSASDILENENERAAENLKHKIGALKSLTIDIGNEVRFQEKILRGIDDDMDRTSGFLGNTISRVIRLGKNNGRRHMFYMLFLVLFVIFLLYLVIKTR